jgi:preprotein translocase subunit SecA
VKVLGILDQIFDSNRKELKRMQKKVDQILELDSRFAAMSDDELKGQTPILKLLMIYWWMHLPRFEKLAPGSWE